MDIYLHTSNPEQILSTPPSKYNIHPLLSIPLCWQWQRSDRSHTYFLLDYCNNLLIGNTLAPLTVHYVLSHHIRSCKFPRLKSFPLTLRIKSKLLSGSCLLPVYFLLSPLRTSYQPLHTYPFICWTCQMCSCFKEKLHFFLKSEHRSCEWFLLASHLVQGSNVTSIERPSLIQAKVAPLTKTHQHSFHITLFSS